MALTITYPSSDWLANIGSLQRADVTATLGTYATGGISFTPSMVALSAFEGAPQFSAAGYAFAWDASASKVLVYRSAGFTPAGTNSAATFTGSAASLTATSSKPTFTVKTGSQVANGTVGLSADTAGAEVYGGTGITADRTLTTTSPVGTPTITPGAYTPAGTNSAATFTGAAVAAGALVQVSNGVDLSAVTVSIVAVGR